MRRPDRFHGNLFIASIMAFLCASGCDSTASVTPAPESARLTPRLQKWHDAGDFLVVNGLRVYYQTQGSGPALLLLHGYPFGSYDFKDIAPVLAQQYRVIMLDWPGMGFSDKPHAPVYSFELYVAVLNALAAQLGVVEADIIAHDLGVSVAQELLAQAASSRFRIRSIAFMNGGLFTDTYQPRWIQRMLSQSPAWFGRLLSRHLGRASIETSVISVFGANTQPSADLLDDYWELLNYQDGKQIAYLLGKLVFEKEKHQHRWLQAMQSTAIPLAYICGPADPNSGQHMAERFRQRLPHSPVFLLRDDIGHWPQLEAPQEVLSAFAQFQHGVTQRQSN